MERENGFYWVRCYNDDWIVAQWFNNAGWRCPGVCDILADMDFDDIKKEPLVSPYEHSMEQLIHKIYGKP